MNVLAEARTWAAVVIGVCSGSIFSISSRRTEPTQNAVVELPADICTTAGVV